MIQGAHEVELTGVEREVVQVAWLLCVRVLAQASDHDVGGRRSSDELGRRVGLRARRPNGKGGAGERASGEVVHLPAVDSAQSLGGRGGGSGGEEAASREVAVGGEATRRRRGGVRRSGER